MLRHALVRSSVTSCVIDLPFPQGGETFTKRRSSATDVPLPPALHGQGNNGELVQRIIDFETSFASTEILQN